MDPKRVARVVGASTKVPLLTCTCLANRLPAGTLGRPIDPTRSRKALQATTREAPCHSPSPLHGPRLNPAFFYRFVKYNQSVSCDGYFCCV